MEETTHSQIGASSAKRFMNCLGSINLINKLGVKSTTSKYAAEGTVAHILAEDALRNRKSIKAIKENIGKTITQEGFKIKVTEEMVEVVIFYTYLILADHKNSNGGELFIEQKFKLLDVDSDARGTSDGVILEPFKILRVYDLKYGKGIKVSSYDNPQLKYYALGGIDLGDFEEVELVIVQPRIDGEADEKVSRFTLTYEELLKFKQELKTAIAETKKPDAPLNSGEWCTFCPALVKCSKYTENLTQLGIDDFKNLDETKLENIKNNSMVEDLGGIKLKLDLLSKWIKEYDKYILEQALAGVKIKDHKLVKSWGHSAWKGSDVEALLIPFGADKIYKQELLSPTKLKKLVGKEFIEKHTYRPDNGLVLTHVSDKRQEWGGEEEIEADFEIL